MTLWMWTCLYTLSLPQMSEALVRWCIFIIHYISVNVRTAQPCKSRSSVRVYYRLRRSPPARRLSSTSRIYRPRSKIKSASALRSLSSLEKDPASHNGKKVWSVPYGEKGAMRQEGPQGQGQGPKKGPPCHEEEKVFPPACTEGCACIRLPTRKECDMHYSLLVHLCSICDDWTHPKCAYLCLQCGRTFCYSCIPYSYIK